MWNIQILGKAEKVAQKLDEYSANISDAAVKAEFDATKPNLANMVMQCAGEGRLVKLTASSRDAISNGQKARGALSANIELLYGDLAL